MTRELTYLATRKVGGNIDWMIFDAITKHVVAFGGSTSWRRALRHMHRIASEKGASLVLDPVGHRRPTGKMTKAFVIEAAKRHGFTARWSTEWSEWRITPRHMIVGETREGATYHTTDNQDAYDSIRAMSRARREARLEVLRDKWSICDWRGVVLARAPLLDSAYRFAACLPGAATAVVRVRNDDDPTDSWERTPPSALAVATEDQRWRRVDMTPSRAGDLDESDAPLGWDSVDTSHD